MQTLGVTPPAYGQMIDESFDREGVFVCFQETVGGSIVCQVSHDPIIEKKVIINGHEIDINVAYKSGISFVPLFSLGSGQGPQQLHSKAPTQESSPSNKLRLSACKAQEEK